jgi:hypothetical protein
MSFAERTFCWLDTKWLCQNSVMRSASGDSVASISRIHQPRISSPRRTCSRMYARRSSFVAPCGRCADRRVVGQRGGRRRDRQGARHREHARDRTLAIQRRVARDLRGGRPEAGACEQVAGAVLADRRPGEGQPAAASKGIASVGKRRVITRSTTDRGRRLLTYRATIAAIQG